MALWCFGSATNWNALDRLCGKRRRFDHSSSREWRLVSGYRTQPATSPRSLHTHLVRSFWLCALSRPSLCSSETADGRLKEVLSCWPGMHHSAPTVAIGIYYRIGFRVEPRDRTGFAHLFEHMMFQGSQNLGKMEMIKLVQQNGGILNGSTRFDFTNYYEIVPANKLETMLWAEADRMRGLAVN